MTMRWLALLVAAGCAKPAPAPAPSPQPALTRKQQRALKRQGVAAYERKDWAACGSLLEQAGDWYDAACCHAQAGARDRAFAALDRVDGRAVTIDHLKQDPDLASLHADPRWPTAVEHVTAVIAAHRAKSNAELAQLHDADQAARQSDHIDWNVVAPQDRARRVRVQQIVDAGGAKTADDWFHAAMVFQHGDTPDEIQHAYDYARRAVELDPTHDTARWLMAAALDRKLMYEKKPQKYGTQYQKAGPDAPWVLYEVDPATTDDEREEMGVPPLAEARARAEQMNARK
ncbi:MAG TPA: hypothetical protein VFQ53_05845 [Kofleriaceae bacterium]|nr:hypothetical protein [Kofleriaceae bacterium]